MSGFGRDDEVDFGTSFGRGRGFTPCEPKNTFGSLRTSSFDSENWDSGESRGISSGQFDSISKKSKISCVQEDSWNSDHDDETYVAREPRGRFGTPGGNLGGERGNGDSFNKERFSERKSDDNSGTGEEPEKPRERYIPPEPSEDEHVIFEGGISSGINFDKYDNITVKVTGENIPRPVHSFEELGLRPLLIENISKSHYRKPTPVQKHAIPIVMAGRDLMACAQTGSGKTAAFLLPVIHDLIQNPTDLVSTGQTSQPQAVIISPTRELTIQTFNEARKFAFGSAVRVCLAYGGTAFFHQINQIMKGCHMLVATPGRLMDMVEKGRVAFNSIRYFILDEADRMLDLGFLSELEKALNHPTMVATGERKTLMFSATFPEEIQRLAGQFLNDYIFLAVGIVGGACADVEQTFHLVPKFEKRPKLTELIRADSKDKTLVFVEMKRTADFIAAFLSQNDYPTTSIHGDRLQREREEALDDFKSGRMPVLVATAVAARGLDIKDVAHVVNYDLPSAIDEYVHRIGRTGRLGNRGKATSFYDPDVDKPLSKELVRILTQASQEVPDWLQKEASESGYSASTSSSYGGIDMRRFGQSTVQEEQEEW